MKAAIIESFGKAEVLQIKEVDKPTINEDEVLIKVNASSINPVDWKHRMGNHKLLKGSKFPIILGYDIAGIIVEKGKNVQQFNVGDRVNTRLTNNYGGGYAEFATAKDNIVSKLPDNISFYEAAALPLAGATALQGLRDKGKITQGHHVLINGAASGVGHLALQLAKYFGAEVTAVCSGRHTSLMDQLKPDNFVDYKQTNIKDLSERYNIIFDIVGTESFKSLKHLLKPKGVYITTLPRPKVLVHKMMSLFTNGLKVKTFLMKSNAHDFDLLNQLLSEAKIKMFIDRVFPLEEIVNAHKYSETGMAEGKIVISVS